MSLCPLADTLFIAYTTHCLYIAEDIVMIILVFEYLG